MIDQEILEIRKAFAIEGGELLAEMESALLALEAQPGDADEFNRLFRTVHTIKGSAGIVMFQDAEFFCHTIEHILVRIREHQLSLNHQLVALLLKCHDHISAMIERYCLDLDDQQNFILPPAHPDLLHQLQEWVKSTSTAPGETGEYGLIDQSYDNKDTVAVNIAENSAKEGVDADREQSTGNPSKNHFGAKENKSRKQSVMRIDAAKIDQLSDLVVELVTAASVLEAQVRRKGDLASTESVVHVADLVKQMQEQTMSLRMVPVQTLFKRFERIIRDIGSSSGKQINLEISGGETELDKTIAEKLYEPLLHLVRNAIDHGIENPKQRAAQGKPSGATIHLQAFHDSGNIVIRVSDDGKGINIQNIAQKALEKGLMKSDFQPAGMNVLSYIFEPGFSTIEDPTMLSGRGVGMDVVRKFVDSIRGRIDVETKEGVGTTFRMSLPLSLSLIDGFMLSLGSNLYILPMDLVQETMELPSSEHLAGIPTGCLQVRHQLLPYLDLRKVLQVSEPPPPRQHVIVIRNADADICLVVDQLHGEIKTLMKPLGRLFHNAKCISGTGILGDGSIAFFLDTGKMISSPF